MGFSNLLWYIITAACSASTVALVKKYTQTKEPILIILSLVSQCILIYAYFVILQDKNITVIYPMIKIMSILMVALLGCLMFGNTFTSKSLLGICFGILSICLLTAK